MEINDEDIKELEGAELGTEERQELQQERQQRVAEGIPSGGEEGSQEVSTALIKEVCEEGVEVPNFVGRCPPDKSLAS